MIEVRIHEAFLTAVGRYGEMAVRAVREGNSDAAYKWAMVAAHKALYAIEVLPENYPFLPE